MTTTRADPPPAGAATAPAAEPIRTCIGCRRRRPAVELVRMAAAGGRLVPGAGAPGRGAWLCRATVETCFEQATKARRWGRALRTELDPASYDTCRAWLADEVTRDTTERGNTGRVSPAPSR